MRESVPEIHWHADGNSNGYCAYGASMVALYYGKNEITSSLDSRLDSETEPQPLQH